MVFSMIKDRNIWIRNVYYMLAYAFEELKKNNYEQIAHEEFEHIQDLFAEILYKGVSAQLKRGLHRVYKSGGRFTVVERAFGYKRNNSQPDEMS